MSTKIFSNLNEVSTLTGKYTAGDTRTKRIGTSKEDVSSDDWQAGFDRIDIAPRDGKLSIEEICAKRDKEVTLAKFSFWIDITNWNPLRVKRFYDEIDKIEAETGFYRKANGVQCTK